MVWYNYYNEAMKTIFEFILMLALVLILVWVVMWYFEKEVAHPKPEPTKTLPVPSYDLNSKG